MADRPGEGERGELTVAAADDTVHPGEWADWHERTRRRMLEEGTIEQRVPTRA